MKNFYQVLINTGLANVTTSFLWFALTFWAYRETESVLATAYIGGGYMLFVALSSLFFGTLVDRHKKKSIMLFASVFTVASYALAGAVYFFMIRGTNVEWNDVGFWLFAIIILAGSVVENMRNIALSTTVTLLVDKDGRDKANGLVGMVQGIGFMITSAISGIAIAFLGMGWTSVVAIGLTFLALIHLLFVHIPEDELQHDPALEGKRFLSIDVKGSAAAIMAVPGLIWLIGFTTFNNLVGGAFMALMDPYGLTLFPVEIWGIVLAVTGTGFIIGGGLVAKFGLGKKPLRTMLIINMCVALLGIGFVIREIWWLYAIGIWIFMCLMPMAEASEQTLLQRLVPLQRQGRVFGLAGSIEAAASPLTAFIVGPVAQFWLIPFMKTEQGQEQWGWLVGDGDARGIALVFIAASLIMLTVAIIAFKTPAYRHLSKAYAES